MGGLWREPGSLGRPQLQKVWATEGGGMSDTWVMLFLPPLPPGVAPGEAGALPLPGAPVGAKGPCAAWFWAEPLPRVEPAEAGALPLLGARGGTKVPCADWFWANPPEVTGVVPVGPLCTDGA